MNLSELIDISVLYSQADSVLRPRFLIFAHLVAIFSRIDLTIELFDGYELFYPFKSSLFTLPLFLYFNSTAFYFLPLNLLSLKFIIFLAILNSSLCFDLIMITICRLFLKRNINWSDSPRFAKAMNAKLKKLSDFKKYF